MDFKKCETGIFPKGIIVHKFGQTVKVFSCFEFIKNRSRKSVSDVLDTKEDFKDYKNIAL